MALIYQGIAFLAALAVALTVFSVSASLVMGFLAYAVTGTLVLSAVFVSAILRQGQDPEGHFMYPAE